MARTADHVAVSPSMAAYNEITEDNIASFHAHGDPIACCPITGVHDLPRRHQGAARIVKARINNQGELPGHRSGRTRRRVFSRSIFRVKVVFDWLIALMAGVTVLLITLVSFLATRLRSRRTRPRSSRIGASQYVPCHALVAVQLVDVHRARGCSSALALRLSRVDRFSEISFTPCEAETMKHLIPAVAVLASSASLLRHCPAARATSRPTPAEAAHQQEDAVLTTFYPDDVLCAPDRGRSCPRRMPRPRGRGPDLLASDPVKQLAALLGCQAHRHQRRQLREMGPPGKPAGQPPRQHNAAGHERIRIHDLRDRDHPQPRPGRRALAQPASTDTPGSVSDMAQEQVARSSPRRDESAAVARARRSNSRQTLEVAHRRICQALHLHFQQNEVNLEGVKLHRLPPGVQLPRPRRAAGTSPTSTSTRTRG